MAATGFEPKEAVVLFDYVVAGVASIGILIYLFFALLFPERF
ncbi:MAG TPA: K(+)-transporting ATPase subunit F [Planktothrix sp.]|jgi:K+-transporting ATPase KdpF subunit